MAMPVERLFCDAHHAIGHQSGHLAEILCTAMHRQWMQDRDVACTPNYLLDPLLTSAPRATIGCARVSQRAIDDASQRTLLRPYGELVVCHTSRTFLAEACCHPLMRTGHHRGASFTGRPVAQQQQQHRALIAMPRGRAPRRSIKTWSDVNVPAAMLHTATIHRSPARLGARLWRTLPDSPRVRAAAVSACGHGARAGYPPRSGRLMVGRCCFGLSRVQGSEMGGPEQYLSSGARRVSLECRGEFVGSVLAAERGNALAEPRILSIRPRRAPALAAHALGAAISHGNRDGRPALAA
mmetsp:Transcript_4767/g.19036  ORF Transcript_4767/g.19036 Transcript_4767/m.19036 type:complete len:296 (-) Transcript_4767:529-1416(-)